MKTIIRFITLFFFTAVFTCCSSSKPKKSIENLRTAFNNETTSAEKYSKFAQTALAEGLDTIASLFEAVSKSENIHAFNHGKALEKYGLSAGTPQIGSFEVKTTAENLETAINSETYEMQTVYLGFIRTAEEEKAPEAAKSFTWARGAEIKHLSYFREAAATLASGNESGLPVSWLVCPVCGNTINSNKVQPFCDFCLNKQENFIGYTDGL